jgi:phage/plasmid-like protein (TIGR03299 family)
MMHLIITVRCVTCLRVSRHEQGERKREMVSLPKLDTISAYDIAEKSKETLDWLRGGNVAVGFTDERGFAWWADEAPLEDGTHFEGPVPEDVVQRILGVPIVEADILLRFPDGTIVEDKNHKAISRGDVYRAMYYSGNGYKIHPYLEVLNNFLTQITHDQHAGVGSVGLLQDGGVAFLQAVLPDNYEVHGFGFQPYITGGTSANGKRKTIFFTGAKAAVCDNTFDMARLAGINLVGVRHTKNSMPSVQNMRDRLGLHLADVAETMSDTFDSLMSVEVSDDQWRKFLAVHVPMPEKNSEDKPGVGWTRANNRQERLTDLYYNDPKCAPWNGTLFGAVQTVNTDRTWNASVYESWDGGRFEKNLAAMVDPKIADQDAEVVAQMSKVLGLQMA